MQDPTWQKSPKQIAFLRSHSVSGFSRKCECRTRTKQRIKLIMLAVFRVHLQTLCCVPPIHYLTSSTGFFMGATMLNMQTLKLKLLLVECLTRCYKYCDSEGREFPPFFCLLPAWWQWSQRTWICVWATVGINHQTFMYMKQIIFKTSL